MVGSEEYLTLFSGKQGEPDEETGESHD